MSRVIAGIKGSCACVCRDYGGEPPFADQVPPSLNDGFTAVPSRRLSAGDSAVQEGRGSSPRRDRPAARGRQLSMEVDGSGGTEDDAVEDDDFDDENDDFDDGGDLDDDDDEFDDQEAGAEGAAGKRKRRARRKRRQLRSSKGRGESAGNAGENRGQNGGQNGGAPRRLALYENSSYPTEFNLGVDGFYCYVDPNGGNACPTDNAFGEYSQDCVYRKSSSGWEPPAGAPGPAWSAGGDPDTTYYYYFWALQPIRGRRMASYFVIVLIL